MTEQTPEVVAAADVSPVSPKPIHTSATSPALVPSLQDHAATLDVAYLDSLTTAPFPFVTMPATRAAQPAANAGDVGHSSSPLSGTIVVHGEGTPEGSQDEDEGVDEESLAVYGEEDDVKQDNAGSQAQRVAESGNGNGNGTETATTAAEPDVSEASSESMINTPSASPSSDSNVQMKTASPTANLSSAEPQTAVTSAHDGADTQDDPNSESQPIADQLAAASNSAAAATPDPAADEHIQGSGNVDVQKLVDQIAAKAVELPSSDAVTSQTPHEAVTFSAQPATTAINLPQSSSLPPKPVITQQAGQPRARPEDFHPFPSRGPPPMPMQGVVHSQAASHGNISYLTANAPGTASLAAASLPPPPQKSFNSGAQPFAPLPNVLAVPGPGTSHREGLHGAQLQQAWDSFQADEKRYMTEAKWERFPDGSRIFIGNLSSERVSKREVFDLFHRFGRLAQISLKSAYGFVQYHSAEDAAAAMQTAEGVELGGRKIHLECSRTQKKKDPQERDHRERSPDRRSQRGGGGPGRGGFDRYEGRGRDRDAYRPGRSPSPRRDEVYGRGGRDGHHSGPYDRNSRGRSRSRSPRSGRYGDDSYRRRSPSPRRRVPPEPQLDIPQRYGEQVPDVQLLLLEEVQRDFVGWIQTAFMERGLKADVMYFNPRFSRDSVLQKLVVEGVHGVIELDLRSQTASRIPLQVFDRSAGSNNVRFDQYQDLDPKVAAELVLRTKQSHARPPQQPQQPAYPTYPPNPYSQYPQQYPPAQAPPAGYPYPQAPVAAPPAPTTLSVQDIAGMAGHVDNNTLQALLASLAAGQQPPQAGGMPTAAPQVDINALLGSLQGTAGAQAPALAYGVSARYAPQMNATPGPPAGYAPPGAPGGSGGDTAAQVQNIMASLARHR